MYQLTPSGAGWTKNILYTFTGGSDGKYPGGVFRDQAGNLYGTAINGGAYGRGVIFELTPSTGGGWTLTVLHTFQGSDGDLPTSLMLDHSGNMYGTTSMGGLYDGGTVFEMTPSGASWIYSVLYSFSNMGGPGPEGGVTRDAAGNLYGTTYFGAGGRAPGEVFKLTFSNGIWTETILHTFDGRSGTFPPAT